MVFSCIAIETKRIFRKDKRKYMDKKCNLWYNNNSGTDTFIRMSVRNILPKRQILKRSDLKCEAI